MSPETRPAYVGSLELSVRTKLGMSHIQWYDRFTHGFSEGIAGNLCHVLTHNVDSRHAIGHVIPEPRALSAFFTYFGGILGMGSKLVVEWGEVGSSGQAKLHEDLRGKINYEERVRNGALLRSGHIATVRIREIDYYGKVALIDSLRGGRNISGLKEDIIVKTLIANDYFVVGNDGYPLKLYG